MGTRLVALVLLGAGCASTLRIVTPPPAPPAAVTAAVGVPARARFQFLLGRLAIEEGDWEAAETALNTALLHDPSSPWILLALADAAAGAGEPEREHKHAQEAVRVAPEMPETWARLGEVELRRGNVRGGLEALREAVDNGAQDPTWSLLCRTLATRGEPDAAGMIRKWAERPVDDPELLRERGRLRLWAGDLGGAAADIGEALPSFPDDARLLDEYLTAVTGSGLYRQGLARLWLLHRLAPANTDVLLRAYHLAAQVRDRVRAEDTLLALDAALRGRDAQVKLWLADVQSALGQHDAALHSLDEASRCDPPLPDAAFHEARLLRAAGRPNEAIRALRIPTAGANRGDALALRARLLVDLNRPLEARREVDAALVQLPEDYALLGALVTACSAQGDRAGMLAAVDRMAMLDDEARARTRARSLGGLGDLDGALLALRATGMRDAETWILGGTLLREAGRVPDAVAWMQEGVDRDPKSASLRAELGVALDAAGARDEALVAMREALRIDPAERRAARYYAGAVGLGEAPERLRLVRGWLLASLERYPGDPELLDSLGQVELGLQSPLRAVDAWEEALRYVPGDAALLRQLSEAYRAIGRPESPP